MGRRFASERRLGWLAVLGGGLLALAVQVAAPVGVPLYDGVVVQEPYRFLHPTGDQAGNPTSYTDTKFVAEGSSAGFAAFTAESPPQAQLIAQKGAFELTPGASSLQVSITPIEPPAPPEGGSIAGNVYRFSVTDQAGAALAPMSCEGCRSLLLRAPDGIGQASIKRHFDGAWADVETIHAGMTGLFQTNPTALGDYAVITIAEPEPGPDPVLLVGGALLLLLVGGGAFLLFRVQQAPAETGDGRPRGPGGPGGPPSRIPSKRKRPPRPPSGRSN